MRALLKMVLYMLKDKGERDGKIFIIILLITVLLPATTAFADPLNISPDCSYILIDAKTGQVILEYNADKKLRPASTTKIMTAIIALES